MRRFFAVLFGVFQIVLGLGFALVILMWLGRTRPLWLGATEAAFIASSLVVVLAAASCFVSGLQWVGLPLPGLPAARRAAISRFGYVLAPLTLGLLATDIAYTATRPMSGEVAIAGLGQPFELKFKAVDGRDVDLRAMKGKVVLLNFWATWCGPCKAELPMIRAAYEKWHARGLEVVGISCDTDAGAVRSFVRANSLPWPTHFDGKGWDNTYRVKFGVRGIPQLWLIDKAGVLRELSAELNLDATLEKYLRE